MVLAGTTNLALYRQSLAAENISIVNYMHLLLFLWLKFSTSIFLLDYFNLSLRNIQGKNNWVFPILNLKLD